MKLNTRYKHSIVYLSVLFAAFDIKSFLFYTITYIFYFFLTITFRKFLPHPWFTSSSLTGLCAKARMGCR